MSPESSKPDLNRSLPTSPTPSKIIEINPPFLKGNGKYISRVRDKQPPPPENMDVEKSCENPPKELSFFDKFSTLSTKEFAMIGLLALGNLCSTTAFSCIAPFYPDEAKLKKLDVIEIGIIFGAFDLVMIITSPLFGKYVC
uniref:Uncharacterized protein n=1 Tax=Panagrolaimus davidi TaxID=227884 RepID=A0A914QYH5_9BILA